MEAMEVSTEVITEVTMEVTEVMEVTVTIMEKGQLSPPMPTIPMEATLTLAAPFGDFPEVITVKNFAHETLENKSKIADIYTTTLIGVQILSLGVRRGAQWKSQSASWYIKARWACCGYSLQL